MMPQQKVGQVLVETEQYLTLYSVSQCLLHRQWQTQTEIVLVTNLNGCYLETQRTGSVNKRQSVQLHKMLRWNTTDRDEVYSASSGTPHTLPMNSTALPQNSGKVLQYFLSLLIKQSGRLQIGYLNYYMNQVNLKKNDTTALIYY